MRKNERLASQRLTRSSETSARNDEARDLCVEMGRTVMHGASDAQRLTARELDGLDRDRVDDIEVRLMSRNFSNSRNQSIARKFYRVSFVVAQLCV